MLVLSPAAAALVVLVVGVPVLCQAEIKLFIWYYENRFFKRYDFHNKSDHLPCGGRQSSPSPSASILPSLRCPAVIFGGIVAGVPPSVVPFVADDTSLPLVVGSTSSVLSPVATAVVGVHAIFIAEKWYIFTLKTVFLGISFIIHQITYLVAVAGHHPDQLHQYHHHCVAQLLSFGELLLEYRLLSYLLLLMILL
jgi:hypothetical protein